MEHIDNPMTFYFAGDEYDPQSPFYEDIDEIEDDEDIQYEQLRESFANMSDARKALLFS